MLRNEVPSKLNSHIPGSGTVWKPHPTRWAAHPASQGNHRPAAHHHLRERHTFDLQPGTTSYTPSVQYRDHTQVQDIKHTLRVGKMVYREEKERQRSPLLLAGVVLGTLAGLPVGIGVAIPDCAAPGTGPPAPPASAAPSGREMSGKDVGCACFGLFDRPLPVRTKERGDPQSPMVIYVERNGKDWHVTRTFQVKLQTILDRATVEQVLQDDHTRRRLFTLRNHEQECINMDSRFAMIRSG